MYNQMDNWEDSLKEAIELHDKGIDGDQESAEQSLKLLKKIKLQQPNNSLVLAYFGSATALTAKYHPNLIEKSKLANKGLRSLDQAVSLDSNHADIRLLRGYVSFKLPEMYFKRTKTAIEDFTFLTDSFAKGRKIPEKLYWQLMFDLGVAYQTIGNEEEALKTWSKIEKGPARSKYQKVIQEAKKEGR